jgi:2'-5' RNA ligase
VAGKNLHLTLVFLGDTDSALVNPMVTAVEENIRGIEPFALSFGSPGFFPVNGSPRVLWLGIRAGVDKLKLLQRKVQSALATLGFVPETRPFSPHLTLARIKSEAGSEALRSRVMAINNHGSEEESMEVVQVELIQSRLGPGGPVYVSLAGITLKAGVY